MIRAVIFDMDGVVADTHAIDFMADYSVLKSIGVVESESDYVREMGKPARQVYLEILAEKGVKADINGMLEMREREIEKALLKKALVLSKGFKELVKSLKASGCRVALASSSSRRKVENVLESLRIRKEFDTIVSGSDVASNKPAPDVYLEAASRLNLGHGECVAVEDSPTGIASAKAAGIRCIALKTRRVPEESLGEADVIVGGLSELDVDKLEKHLK